MTTETPKEPKELARIFNMNVNQLSALTGYSRQYLHMVISRRLPISKSNLKIFMSRLKYVSQSQYDQALVQAENERYERDRILEELAQSLLQGNSEEQGTKYETLTN